MSQTTVAYRFNDSASTSDAREQWHTDSGTANTLMNFSTFVQFNEMQSTAVNATFQRGYIEVTANAPSITTYRVQYAWLDPDVRGFNGERFWSGQFAPMDEFVEIDNPEFRRYLQRLVNDPVYREQQLDAQKRLFAQQNEVPFWTTEGLDVYHKFLTENPTYADIGIEVFRKIFENIESHELQFYPVNPETGLVRFYGIEIPLRGFQLLKELLKNTDERVEELYADYRRRLQAHDHYLNAFNANTPFTGVRLPLLSREQQEAADASALKLLQGVLSPSEAEALIKDGHVNIPSPSDPECIYLIKRSSAERIEVYKKGVLQERLCIYFKEPMHRDDIVLSKIMMVKHDEEGLLKTANHFRNSRVMAPTPVLSEGTRIIAAS